MNYEDYGNLLNDKSDFDKLYEGFEIIQEDLPEFVFENRGNDHLNAQIHKFIQHGNKFNIEVENFETCLEIYSDYKDGIIELFRVPTIFLLFIYCSYKFLYLKIIKKVNLKHNKREFEDIIILPAEDIFEIIESNNFDTKQEIVAILINKMKILKNNISSFFKNSNNDYSRNKELQDKIKFFNDKVLSLFGQIIDLLSTSETSLQTKLDKAKLKLIFINSIQNDIKYIVSFMENVFQINIQSFAEESKTKLISILDLFCSSIDMDPIKVIYMHLFSSFQNYKSMYYYCI